MASEYFSVVPDEVAGLGEAVAGIGWDACNCGIFVAEHCKVPATGFGGAILQPVIAPINKAVETFRARMGGIGSDLLSTSGELRRAAWTYSAQDFDNYSALNAVTVGLDGQPVPVVSDREMPGFVKPYPTPVAYAKPNEIKLDPPSAAPAELADLIADTTGVIGDVNDTIKNCTRLAGHEINVLETILSPITVNWNELRRIGESFKLAGNMMEASGKNLDAGVVRVGPHWDGKAARGFEDWAARQLPAMKWEGPVGRVISDLLNKAADVIRDNVRRVCESLKDMLASFIDLRSIKGIAKTVLKKIPGIGWGIEAFEMGTKLLSTLKLVQDIVSGIEKLRDAIKTFFEFLENPVNTSRQKVEQKLEPYTGKADYASEKVAQAADLATVLQDAKAALGRSGGRYEAGSGTDPWADAV